jgi:hypothetical protein
MRLKEIFLLRETLCEHRVTLCLIDCLLAIGTSASGCHANEKPSEKLSEAIGTPPQSLIRVLGPRGNPQARNLFGITGYLQKQAGVELQVVTEPG